MMIPPYGCGKSGKDAETAQRFTLPRPRLQLSQLIAPICSARVSITLPSSAGANLVFARVPAIFRWNGGQKIWANTRFAPTDIN